MIHKFFLYFILAFSCCQFVAPKAHALQCRRLLSGESESTLILKGTALRQQGLQGNRKALEIEIHTEIGRANLPLDSLLKSVFNNGVVADNLTLMNELKQDLSTFDLYEGAHAEIINLVKTQAMRPYMAILLVRYKDSVRKENPPKISYEALENIESVVRSYIIERALLMARKRLTSNPDVFNQRDVMSFLEKNETGYSFNSLTKVFTGHHLMLSNFFYGLLQEVEFIIYPSE